MQQGVRGEPFAGLSRFRGVFYDCLTGRRDALFELTDAMLCTDGPVRTLVDLVLAPEHRRGHGALYGALNRGRVDVSTGYGSSWPACRCRAPPTAAWSCRWTSHRGCGRTPRPARTARSVTPSAAATPSTR
ncbi:transposase [Kitasatospora griseola]|uniref:transposase n=1 Tax=Kitasatospora griseola TaxID=2064 RepID=UPI0035714389